MKSKGKRIGFTIIELLTVMSIIVILIGLLVPSLNAIKRYAKVVAQQNQFRNIGSGLEMFQSDFDEYPDSSAVDADGALYCGAMKLCEVMAGQDGLGFHLDSKLTADDGTGQDELYPEPPPDLPYPTWYVENLRSRKEYLEAKDIQVSSLSDLYSSTGSFTFPADVGLLCDVFRSVRNRNTGQRMGMPILYYRADTSKLLHDVNDPTEPDNIYNYLDNHPLLNLGLPWEPTTKPPLFQKDTDPEGRVFYENTLDESATIARPYNKDSYILISAGWDGIYGSKDDVYNFKR